MRVPAMSAGFMFCPLEERTGRSRIAKTKSITWSAASPLQGGIRGPRSFGWQRDLRRGTSRTPLYDITEELAVLVFFAPAET